MLIIGLNNSSSLSSEVIEVVWVGRYWRAGFPEADICWCWNVLSSVIAPCESGTLLGR